jgi:hypothetical protein
MDNKKFEQLIDLIINENEEQARALFHDIVVEKSREIYENIIAEEMDMEEGGMAGQVGDLMDEISAEESGVIEGDEEEEFDISDDDGDEVVDFEAGEGEDEDQGGDLEDRVVDLEDKLDQLMAEFEEIMGDDEAEAGEEDFEAGEEAEEDQDMMEAADDEEDEEDDEEDMTESLEEAIQLKKVSVTHGDNGQQTKSTVAANSGAKGMASKPVSMGNGSESVPTGPKGPSNAYSKGETQVKGATSWKNAPAQAGQDLEKAPAPKHGDNGQNTKSVIEGRQTAKKRI